MLIGGGRGGIKFTGQSPLSAAGGDLSKLAQVTPLADVVFGHTPVGEAVLRGKAGSPHPCGDCLTPKSVELFEGRRDVHASVTPAGVFIRLVRCRKCEACLRHRRQVWFARMMSELGVSPRTWFVTLTWRGEEPTAPYRDVQLWLKRLRKRAKLRFVAVQERGDEGGRLHWHLLVHTGVFVRARHVREDWPQGFCKATLAKSANVGYLANYASGAMLRVHASTGYGRIGSDLASDERQ